MSLTTQIKEFALDIGYSKVGIMPADSFQRNAAIALGNLGDPANVSDLAVAMKVS